MGTPGEELQGLFACGHSAHWRPFQSQLSQSYHPWFVSTVAQLAEAQEYWFPRLQGHWRPWPISLDQNSSHKSSGNLHCCGKCRKSCSRKLYPSHMSVLTLGIWMGGWRVLTPQWSPELRQEFQSDVEASQSLGLNTIASIWSELSSTGIGRCP